MNTKQIQIKNSISNYLIISSIIFTCLLSLMFIFSSTCYGNEFSKNECSPGGVTFDFSTIAKTRMQNNKLGKNLISNGDFSLPVVDGSNWLQSVVSIHLSDKKLVKKIRAQIIQLATMQIIKTKKGNAGRINMSSELEKVCKNKSTKISNSWFQHITLTTAGQYRLTFNYRGQVAGNNGGTGYIIIVFKDAKGKNTRRYLSIGCPEQQLTWHKFGTEFTVPKKTVKITLFLRYYGAGIIDFNNIQLFNIRRNRQPSLKLMPMAWLDNTFVLSSSDPAVMMFAWRNSELNKDVKISRPVLHLDLPETVEVKAVWRRLKIIAIKDKLINGNKFKSYSIDLRSIKGALANAKSYRKIVSLLLFTKADSSVELPDAFYWLEGANGMITEQENFSLKIIPKISTARHPTIFMSGLHLGYGMNFNGNANRELLADFVGRLGFQWLDGNIEPEQIINYRHHGIKIITANKGYIANGYRIGPPQNKPTEAKFIIDGKSQDRDINWGTCPTAIYTHSDFFKNKIVPYVKKNLQYFDGLWANWEPYMFNERGCFCDNCRQQFIKFSHLDAQTVDGIWGKSIVSSKKYHKLWSEFRSWQHAAVVKTLNLLIMQATTGKAGFIPGISWVTMSYSKKGADFSKEYNVKKYAADLQFINPWGPYIYWDALRPYVEKKAPHLQLFIAAKNIRMFTDKNFSKYSHKPKLMAFVHGLQASTWVTQPEAIIMDTLSFFLNRFTCSLVYYFPDGYDNRYWQALSKCNSLIAEYEAFVFSGKPCKQFTVSPLTAYPAPIKKISPNWLSNIRNSNLYQIKSYKLGNKYLVAVGNFWEKGQLFFNLTANNLEPNKKYTISQPAVQHWFIGKKNNWFSAAEIKQGVTLHVGALRWAFFIIEPYQKNIDYGKKITPSQMEYAVKLLKQRKMK